VTIEEAFTAACIQAFENDKESQSFLANTGVGVTGQGLAEYAIKHNTFEFQLYKMGWEAGQIHGQSDTVAKQ
jgi:hypothetical protein